MNKVILITGVSSGFGKETAGILADRGHKVYGTIRKGTGSEKLVKYLYMDLTDPVSVNKAVDDIIRNEGRIDVLINNAGMHTGGPSETLPEEYIKLQLETNFMGMVRLTRKVLPIMRKQGRGTIINLSSIGGLMGLPFQSFYSACKFATEGFSEALRIEVKSYGINVVLINPGDFNTNNTANRRNFLAASGDDDPYTGQFKKTLAVIEKDETNGWKPSVLARKLANIAESDSPAHRYIIASSEQKLAVLLKYILPSKWFMAILAGHYKVP
jgi:NAD(P)-dependent dehydrogenase (short-subunit alcohol dehydrogenase family)